MNSLPKNAARDNMLKSQILPGHVLDERILDAIMAVAREEFVPPGLKGAAYTDEEVPLGSGRFLMEPLDLARMLKHAALNEDETVLTVGCATGYSAAVLSKIARRVVAIEEEPELCRTATALLADCPNVAFRQVPLIQGFSGNAPYDAILIEGAIEYLPQAFSDQLREGGRLLAAEHDTRAQMGAVGLSKFVEYRKVRGTLFKTVLRDCNMALIPAFRRKYTFVL